MKIIVFLSGWVLVLQQAAATDLTWVDASSLCQALRCLAQCHNDF